MFNLAKLRDFRGGVKPSLLMAGAILTASIPFQSAQAASFQSTFTFLQGDNPSSSGTAYFTVNDSAISAIGPDSLGDVFSDVTAFTATFTGLSTSPTTTTFTLADLAALFVRTDANTNVNAAAYFTSPNVDGYSLGTPFFGYQILQSDNSSTVYLETTNAVPEPLTMLGSAAALGFGAAFKRKLAKKQDKSLKS